MKTCPKCGSHKVIIFDSDNDYCEKCKRWFPAVADEPEPDHKEFIAMLADDVWAVAKKIDNYEESNKLKRISSCLHDLRADRDVSWYEKMRSEQNANKID